MQSSDFEVVMCVFWRDTGGMSSRHSSSGVLFHWVETGWGKRRRAIADITGMSRPASSTRNPTQPAPALSAATRALTCPRTRRTSRAADAVKRRGFDLHSKDIPDSAASITTLLSSYRVILPAAPLPPHLALDPRRSFLLLISFASDRLSHLPLSLFDFLQ